MGKDLPVKVQTACNRCVWRKIQENVLMSKTLIKKKIVVISNLFDVFMEWKRTKGVKIVQIILFHVMKVNQGPGCQAL